MYNLVEKENLRSEPSSLKLSLSQPDNSAVAFGLQELHRKSTFEHKISHNSRLPYFKKSSKRFLNNKIDPQKNTQSPNVTISSELRKIFR